ncbi:MAG: putative toxin-antitoxin system toxin component, PIN family [Deltaproteobacteria bacterium RIFCSPHIGHO2_02_FULL_40_11]|nr:MAG: putative toxin-antitoxin system toxin component, PIN family [Deltaproteobacteria bacterium RIFCSPHIGHO2_02_FULL_40_11]
MKKRVVVDTNVVLSGFLSKKGAPSKILDAWIKEEFTPLLSPELKQEYFSVLEYNHIKQRLGYFYAEAYETLNFIVEKAQFINIKNSKICIFTDRDDDILMRIAMKGSADYIVSGDKSVLKIKNYKNIQIITATEFLEVLE